MEPKINPSDNFRVPRPDSGTSLDMSATPVFEEVAQPVVGQSLGKSGFSLKINREAVGYTAGAMIVVSLMTALTVFLSTGPKNDTARFSSGNYGVSSLDVNNISPGASLSISQASRLAINGELEVGNGLYLVPGTAPVAPKAGEIYFDKTTNQPYYYNGSAFVSLSAVAVPQAVTALGGAAGIISLGSGLSVNGNELSIAENILQSVTVATAAVSTPRVNSLQGLTGDITFTAGSGITINGTTISATGGSGVSLGPSSPQGDSTGNSSISIDKTGLGNFFELASGGVNRFVVDQTGAITTGTISYSQVQGRPATTVTSIGGLSNTVTLGSGLGVLGSDIVNTGVISLAGTANQVSVSASSGAITVSLPQNIATTSSPTFGGLTLNGGISVTSGNASVAGNISAVGSVSSGDASTQGSVIIYDGTGRSATLQPAIIGQNTVYTLPDPGSASATICLTIGNCATAGSAGGDLTGNYPNPTIASLQGTSLSIAGLVAGQFLQYNGTEFVNQSITGDITVGASGVSAIGAAKVTNAMLQNSSIAVVAGSGLSGGGSASLGGSTNISVAYGSAAATSVQGNTTITCASGTGNLSGGGDTITLGSGGTCSSLTISNSPTFTGTLTVTGAGGLVAGDTTTAGLLTLNDGSANTAVIQTAALGQNTTFTVPDPGQASANFCLSTGNCATAGAAGGDLTGTYPNPTIAKIQGVDLTISSLTSGNILQYNGTDWVNQSLSGDVTMNASGVTTIGAGTVTNAKLVNSSLTVTAGNGLSGGGAASLGGSTSLSVAYGSAANTSVQGNTTITCASGTGNLSGGGDTITLGSGGTCSSLTISNSPTFTGTLTVTGAGGLVAGDTTTAGLLTLNDGSANTAVIQTAALGQNTTYTLPDPGQATATICLTTGNCAGSGGGIIGSGTAGQIAKFTAAGTIGDSALSEASATLTYAGNLVVNAANGFIGNLINVQLNGANRLTVTETGNTTTAGTLTVSGASATIGTTSQQGSLILNDGSANTAVIQTAALGQNTTYTLPDPGQATATICLTTGNCAGSGGGIIGSGTAGQIAKFTAAGTIGDSALSEASATLTYAGNLVVNAANGFIGNLINVQLNGANRLTVTETGNLTAAGTINGAAISGGTLSGGTLTATAVNGLDVSSTAITSTAALGISGGGTSNITLNAGTTGQVQIGGSSTGDILLGGGSGLTGCTLTNATGAFACSSTLNGATISGGTLSGGTVTGGSISAGNITGGTLSATAVNSLNVSGTAISGTGALTVDANGANTISIGSISTGDILLSGGSGSTGCTIANATGNFACTGTINGATISGGTLSGGTFSGGSVSAGTVSGGTLSATAVNSLNVSGTAIQGTGSLTIDGTAAGTISLGAISTGDILLGGGSGSTGCTVTNASGNFVCAGTLQGTQLISTVTTGTAPLTVSSTTLVTNLNADLLDGLSSAAFAPATGGSYIAKNTNDTSSASYLGTLLGLTNSNTGAAGVLSLTNAGTNSALTVTQSSNPSGVQGILAVDNSNGIPTGNLLRLSTGGTGRFSVDVTGYTVATGTIVSDSGTNGVFRSQNTAASSATSSAANFKSGDATGASSSNSGNVFVYSGNSTINGNTGNVAISTGNAAGGNSGNITLDVGTASGTAGTISVGSTNTTAVNISRTGVATTVNGTLTVTQATSLSSDLTVNGTVAFRKGTDYAISGTVTSASFSAGSLIRLDSSGTPIIDTIASGVDGRLLTLVNFGSVPVTIRDSLSAVGPATERIITGTGANYSLPVDGSMTLIYDSGSSRWRMTASSSTNSSATPMARVYNSTNISTSNGVFHTLTFDSERIDNAGIHSTSSNTGRLTATTSGFYQINGSVIWDAGGVGQRQILIRVNGAINIDKQDTLPTGGGTYTAQSISTSYYLNAGDYLELIVYQNNGGSLNILNQGNNSPEFSMVKVDGSSSGGISVVGALGGCGGPSVNGASISGSSICLQAASSSDSGIVTTGTQTFAGDKSFTGLVQGNVGLTVTGGAVNLNSSSNFATNINTGTSQGAVTIGNTGANAGAILLRSGSSGSIGLEGATVNINVSTAANTNICTQAACTGAVNIGNSAAGNIVLNSGTNINLNGTVVGSKSYSVATGGEQYGASLNTTYSAADTSLKQGVRINTAANHASGTVSNLSGVTLINSHNGAGTTSTSSNLWVRNDANAGTITSAYGLNVQDGVGAGAIQTQYGVYVSNLTKGAANNWAVYTAGTTPSYFGGNINTPSSISYTDASKYLWNFDVATNWGMHWDTTSNIVSLQGGAVNRFSVDLDNGNTVVAGSLSIGGLTLANSGGYIYSASPIWADAGLFVVGGYSWTNNASRMYTNANLAGAGYIYSANYIQAAGALYTDNLYWADNGADVMTTNANVSLPGYVYAANYVQSANNIYAGGTLIGSFPYNGGTQRTCLTGTPGAYPNNLVDCVGTPGDYAESYPVSSDVGYGDIVVTGTKLVETYAQAKIGQQSEYDWETPIGKVTQLIKSSTVGQQNTIGIAVDNHNEGSSIGKNIKPEDNPMPVALKGRVTVKISEKSDAIAPGDYITTSTDLGKGMKATSVGFVIGKALEPWTPGTGDPTVMIYIEQGHWSGPTPIDYIQDGGNATLTDLVVTGTAEFSNLNVSGNTNIANLTAETLNVVGSISIGGNLTVQGLATVVDIVVGGHIITAGDVPVTEALSALGGGTFTIDGNDTAGTITFTTGAIGVTAGELGKINFKKVFGKTPRIIVSGQDEQSDQANIFPSAKTTNSFKLKSGQALAPNTTYTFDYFVVE